MLQNILLKHCVVTSIAQHNDVPCFGYALFVACTHLDKSLTAIQGFVTDKNNLVEEIRDIFTVAGVEYGPVDFSQYHRFLPCLPPNSRLIIIDAKEQNTSLLYKSDVVNPDSSNPIRNVCLLLCEEHYYAVTSLSAWFGRSCYCVDCEVGYNTRSKHECKTSRKCHFCTETNCLFSPSFTRCCNKCFGAFRNSTCFNNHRNNGVCTRASTCSTCGRWFNSKVPDHECNVQYCSYCSKRVKPDHCCFVDVKEPTEIKSWKYIFYDFESTQNTIDNDTGRYVHVVNYCVAMSVCHRCEADEPCDTCKIHTFSGLNGRNALNDFCAWAFDSPENRGATFIAHNGSNYDQHFLLSYLIDNAEYPSMLANGCKLMEMKIKTCKARLIDSCCFLSMPLNKFSETFNIPHVKGTFPHLFNKSENYGYVGKLPDISFYDPDGMKEPARTQFIKWHNAHANDAFDFAKEIHDYCKADVQLLKAGCMKFRAAFIADTGLDPFQNCTIAGSCMDVLRSTYLKANTIGRIPVDGYRNNRNYSNKSIECITYFEKITGVSYRHDWHANGEKYLTDANAWADGYYESSHHKYVIAFMGCHFHGCRRCYDLTTHNTHLNRSMGDLYRESIRWIKRVTNNGYKLSVVWECDWDRMVKNSPDIQEHLESYSLSTPLLPRDCLYRGRCETFTLHAVECDESVIKYVDVQSLYPYVCKNKHYPVGHPRCLMGPNLTGMNFTEFEGPVKCKILPPRGLMIPLLPSHINGKLMFVLCRKCTETESSTPCGHSDNDRSLTGTWISVELQKAVSVGYIILKVYEVWQYDTTTVFDSATADGGLFAMYMNTFMKNKMEATGYPKECVTEVAKRDYVQRVKRHEGIRLDPDNIAYNAGRRAVAKLCLNNIWGKFARTPDRTTKAFVTDPRFFYHLLTDDGYSVSEAQPVNDDCLYVSYKKVSEFQTPPLSTNVVIAAYVTTHARLELYSYLEQLGERALYCDTDSVIYRHVDGLYNPALSEFVGGMTNELTGSHITEYVSNGPKNYAYRTADGKQVVKVKGFTLNHVASRQLTFDVMKDLAVAEQQRSITVVERPQIQKDLKRRQINTMPSSKSYQRVFDKRVRNQQNHSSLPFGYA